MGPSYTSKCECSKKKEDSFLEHCILRVSKNTLGKSYG